MSAPVPVLIYAQHLLGTGHLRRAAAIARATAEAGLGTVLVSGGMPLPDLDTGAARLVQLPPLRARDDSFAELVDAEGRPAGESLRAARTAALLALFDDLRPRILMTEMFPFGRRQMRFELLPLVERARAAVPRPRILCSLRDVLTTHRKPGKTEWMLDTFARLYDQVLVHGDPDILPLERSLPRAADIAARLRYTGYVLDPAPASLNHGDNTGAGEVIVSTGGGAVAGPLIEAALRARALTPLAAALWRILVGHNYPEAGFRAAAARAPAGVTVERARPDFRALLARARLSISQGGYNTVLEVLAAGVPAVVVPFSASGETEQALRARAFAARGLLAAVEAAPLTAEALAAGISEALARPPRGLTDIKTDGAAETARLLASMGDLDIVRP